MAVKLEPETPFFAAKSELLSEILGSYPEYGRRSAIMPLLWAVQRAERQVSEARIEEIAAILGLTATEVKGVMSFYSTYHERPVGRYHLQLCSTLSCSLAGSDEMYDFLVTELGIVNGETDAEGLFSLQKVECLGSCGTAPVLQVNDDYYERVSRPRCQALLEALRGGEQPEPRRERGGDSVSLEEAEPFATGGRPGAAPDPTTPITSRHDPRYRVTMYRHVGVEGSHTLDYYRGHGGYQAAERALTRLSPAEVIGEVKASGLRGRGGAGFPTGVKWSFMPPVDGRQRFILCNADESEPGSFKDRYILEDDPHQLIEGMIIAGHAIAATLGVIYIRGEYYLGYRRLRAAIAEARGAGLLGRGLFGTEIDFDLILHRGAGAYICGEETALMNSFEGLRANPRLKPPFPAQVGIYGLPTTINNVTTLTSVVHIIGQGAAWFAAIGSEDSKGTKLYQISGPVERPGVYELPMGATFRELIFDLAGGPTMPAKAFIPGGSSAPLLPFADAYLDTPMDYGSLAELGSMLGTGGVIVIPEEKCMVSAIYNLVRFYAHESCGKCTPCREGVATWLPKLYQKLLAGLGSAGDLTLIEELAHHLKGTAFCLLADSCALPVEASFAHFRSEYEYLVERGEPRYPRSDWWG